MNYTIMTLCVCVCVCPYGWSMSGALQVGTVRERDGRRDGAGWRNRVTGVGSRQRMGATGAGAPPTCTVAAAPWRIPARIT